MCAAVQNWQDEQGTQYLSLVPPGPGNAAQGVRKDGLVQTTSFCSLYCCAMRRTLLRVTWLSPEWHLKKDPLLLLLSSLKLELCLQDNIVWRIANEILRYCHSTEAGGWTRGRAAPYCWAYVSQALLGTHMGFRIGWKWIGTVRSRCTRQHRSLSLC